MASSWQSQCYLLSEPRALKSPLQLSHSRSKSQAQGEAADQRHSTCAPEPRYSVSWEHCVARKSGEGYPTIPGVREGFLEEGTMFKEDRSAKLWE